MKSEARNRKLSGPRKNPRPSCYIRMHREHSGTCCFAHSTAALVAFRTVQRVSQRLDDLVGGAPSEILKINLRIDVIEAITTSAVVSNII